MNIGSKRKPDAFTLYDLYVNKRMFQSAIAQRYNVCERTIAAWLQSYGIKAPRRGRPKKLEVKERQQFERRHYG